MIWHPSFGFLAFRIWPSSVRDPLALGLLANEDDGVVPLEAASAIANAPRKKSGVSAMDMDHVLGELNREREIGKLKI